MIITNHESPIKKTYLLLCIAALMTPFAINTHGTATQTKSSYKIKEQSCYCDFCDEIRATSIVKAYKTNTTTKSQKKNLKK